MSGALPAGWGMPAAAPWHWLPVAPRLSPIRVVLVALLLELLLLGLAAALVSRERAPAPPPEQRVELVFDDAPPEVRKEEAKPEPKPEPPPPEIKPKLVQPKAAPVRQVQAQTVAEPPLTPATPAPASPVATVPVSEPVPPAPPPQAANRAAEREAEFADRLKAAIQAAVIYPAAARNMGLRGRVRVEFYFRDGVSSRLRIVQSGGSGMLDAAALAAVTGAAVPPLPETLRGREMTYQVTVVFELKGGA